MRLPQCWLLSRANRVSGLKHVQWGGGTFWLFAGTALKSSPNNATD